MRRSSWVVLGLIVVAVVATGSMAACSGENRSVNVDPSYSGKQIELSVGDSLIVTLPADNRTGYSWTGWVSDDRILEKTNHEYIGQLGAGGKDIWTYAALKKGECTVTLEYSLPEEEGVEPTQKVVLTVIVS